MTMLITASHITKYNNLKCIVDDVSFTINEQDKVALIGINGTGKSTLLKMIAGIENHDGTILKKKDITINYLPQNPDFQDHHTILEQVYTYIDKHVPEYEIKAILNKFGISNHQQKIAELSGGQQKRIALAITLLKPCDLLLLDEPTNHLDNEMIEYLEKYLMKFNKAIFMVTHDRYFMERITNKIFELDRSQIYEYNANYSQFLELKAQREEIAMNAERKRKLFLKKELEWVRAGVQARSTKSKDRLQRFDTLNNQADRQVIQNVEMIDVASRLGKKTIELIDVSMSFDNQELFKPLSYHFKRNDRIGILGQNGCGKSTLLNMISGLITPTHGHIEIGDTIKIGYFKQGHGDMNPQLRVIDYIKETAQILETNDGTLTAKQMCEKFLFDSTIQYTPIERLSGGEKRRLYLLKILMEAPNVLLLDEPTNDLDIDTLQILEDYLDNFNGIILTVSHDRYFLDRICDHLFVFKDQIISYHIGGYSDYIDISSSQIKQKTNISQPREKKIKIKLNFKEKQELSDLEENIPLLEQQLKDIDIQMNGVTDFEVIQELTLKREKILLQLDDYNEHYIELLEKQEAENN